MSEDYNDPEYEDDGKASNDVISSVSKDFESASTEAEKSWYASYICVYYVLLYTRRLTVSSTYFLYECTSLQ